MKSMISSLAARFSEPSSWAGIAGLASVAGLNVPPGLLQAGIYVGAGIAGVIAFFMPDVPNQTTPAK